MSLIQLIPVDLQISIALILFCVGLNASSDDFLYVLRRPSLLVRSVLAMNVVMPIIAAGIAAVFDLRRALEVALILLAVSPVPPVLPKKEVKAGGNASYGVGLLGIAAVIAIFSVPVSVTLLGQAFGRPAHVPMSVIAKVVTTSVLVPLIAGAAVRRFAPAFAERYAKPISIAGTLLLLLAIVPIFVVSWPAIVRTLGDFTLVAIVLFTLVSLAVGHLLGGPAPDDRTVLALSTATRHPGVALAIASANVDGDQKKAVAAALLLCMLTASIVTTPYVRWRRARAAGGSRP